MESVEYSRQKCNRPYFASEREAAFAMTVFPKFPIAVRMSTSSCVVGGIKPFVRSVHDGGSHDGIWKAVSFSMYGPSYVNIREQIYPSRLGCIVP